MDNLQEASNRSLSALLINVAASALTGAEPLTFAGVSWATGLFTTALGLDGWLSHASQEERQRFENALRRLINQQNQSVQDIFDELANQGIEQAFEQVSPADLNKRLTALSELIHLINRNVADQTQRLASIETWVKSQNGAFDAIERLLQSEGEDLKKHLKDGMRASVADEISPLVEQIAQLNRRGRTSAKLLVPGDFSPNTGKPPDLEVGRRPSLELLRDQQYMPRPELVRSAAAALKRLVVELGRVDYRGLDIFWIDGRSGCGKSVLLLDLMEDLVKSGSRVVWLADRVAALAPLLEETLQHTDPGVDFIFVDDLYDPQARQQLETRDISSLVNQNPKAKRPIVVTCGPPEFHQSLTRDSAHAIKIHTWTLSPVMRGEAVHLRKWFRHRTGRAAKTGAAFKQREGLIISMSFEMLEGGLQPFAVRFCQRLKANDLTDTLRLPLALHRLYVWSPASWLTRRDRERIEALRQAGDFTLDMTPTRSGHLRLTHPHLSDAIYTALRDPANGVSFANDLVEAFDRALQTDLSVACQLLGLFNTKHPRLDIVDKTELAIGCINAWKQRAPAWLNASDHQDRPEWVRLWRHLLDEPTVSFLSRSDRAELLTQGRTWLNASGHKRRWEWSYVWQRLIDEPAASFPSKSDRADLLAQGRKWLSLSSSRKRRGWTYVWERLLDEPAAPPSPEIRAELLVRGRKWLNAFKRQEQLDWTHVWQRLINEPAASLPPQINRAELLMEGEKWLTAHPNYAGWGFVWQDLVREATESDAGLIDADEMFRMGSRWLIEHAAQPSNEWNCILEKIVDTGVCDRSLLVAGANWILKHPAEKQSAILASKMLQISPGDPALCDLAGWFALRVLQHPNDRRTLLFHINLRPSLVALQSHGGQLGKGWVSLLTWHDNMERSRLDLLMHFKQCRANGMKVRGQFAERSAHGYWVYLGGIDAYLHESLLAYDFRQSKHELFGIESEFWIVTVRPRGITVSQRLIARIPCVDLTQSFQVGQILEATVIGIEKDGVFLEYEGIKGLLPQLQLDDDVDGVDPSGRHVVGQRVHVRIVAFDATRNRLAFATP